MLDVTELTAVLEDLTRMHIRLPVRQRLSFTTLSVLHTLEGRGPMRLTELTAAEQVTQPAITQLVAKLERDGLVERRPDPSDGRAVLVHVTNAGAAVVRSRRAERVAGLERLAAALTPAALPALARIARSGDEPGGHP